MTDSSSAGRAERIKNLVAIILTVGLGSAVVLFFTAQAPGSGPLGDPNDSKRYLRDMEMFGGKANLLTAQFREWVGGLFQGRSLALTVAILALLLAWAVWFFGMPLPPEPPGEGDRS